MSIHHRNLGVRVGATKAEIKKAYRTIAMRLHPDKNSDPMAGELFAELQDSYDALMNPKVTSSSSSSKSERKTKTPEQRRQEARKRYQEHMRRQKEEDERYFQSLVSGYRGIYFKSGMILCGVVLIALLFDTFLPRHQFQDEFTTFSNIKRERSDTETKASIGTLFNGNYTLGSVEYFTLNEYPELYVEKTRLFHFPYQVVHPVEGKLHKHKIYNSFWRILPIPLIIFVIPAILLFYRKRTARFTALYMASCYAVFPLIILFLIDEARILHLLSLGFI